MMNLFQKWMLRIRPENPRRIRDFRLKLKDLNWNKEATMDSLSTLFDAVDDLAEAEVQYYYRRRGTRAWISGVTRIGAWILGTIGLLLPLLAGAAGESFKDWGQYGYVFLAGAASCLGANALFGGTEGHIRFVSTQLELEKLITNSRIEWCKYLVKRHDSDESIGSGFALILAYANALHATTIAETGRWAETIMAELAKFQKSIEAKQNIPAKE